MECSHGWRTAEAKPGDAQPVETNDSYLLSARPGGAKDLMGTYQRPLPERIDFNDNLSIDRLAAKQQISSAPPGQAWESRSIRWNAPLPRVIPVATSRRPSGTGESGSAQRYPATAWEHMMVSVVV